MRPPPPTPKLCPVCGKALVVVKMPVYTVNGDFVRRKPACQTCKIFVLVHRPRLADLQLIADATEAS
jgi:hypothetical protein